MHIMNGALTLILILVLLIRRTHSTINASAGLLLAVLAQTLLDRRNVDGLVFGWCGGDLGDAILAEGASRLMTLVLPEHFAWTALILLNHMLWGHTRNLARPTTALISRKSSTVQIVELLLAGLWSTEVVELIRNHHHPRAILAKNATVSISILMRIALGKLFAPTHLFLLLVHLHYLHDWLLHFDLFSSIIEGAHLKSIV